MKSVFLVHANCLNDFAKGDFAFAGSIARDLMDILPEKGMDVFLVSSVEQVRRFESLYGQAIEGRITIDNQSIGLSSLEHFDPITYKVVGFIDANQCKYPDADKIKRIIAPNCKILHVKNANYSSSSVRFYFNYLNHIQPQLYKLYNQDELLINVAGFSEHSLGLPKIKKITELSRQGESHPLLLNECSYGFMYLAWQNSEDDILLIAQFMALTNQQDYILVGDFKKVHLQIDAAYKNEAFKKTPHIDYVETISNNLMRHLIVNSSPLLVLTTGIASTLEALRDKKLVYYQRIDNTQAFVDAYLLAIKDIILADALPGMAGFIIQLSEILFAEKPLYPEDVSALYELLNIKGVSAQLIDANQKVLDRACGKMAPQIFGFFANAPKKNKAILKNSICIDYSLDIKNPNYSSAFIQASGLNKLFDLKILFTILSREELLITAPRGLYLAVINGSVDCARFLIQKGASALIVDQDNRTLLHHAVKNKKIEMIGILLSMSIPRDVKDIHGKTMRDYALLDSNLLHFIDEHLAVDEGQSLRF